MTALTATDLDLGKLLGLLVGTAGAVGLVVDGVLDQRRSKRKR